MASGVNRVRVGQYLGTGVAQSIIGDKVGFQPKCVKIARRTTAIDLAENYEGMPALSFYQTVGATGVRTLVTSQGITLLTTGFSVGTDTHLNNAGDTYDYIAYE